MIIEVQSKIGIENLLEKDKIKKASVSNNLRRKNKMKFQKKKQRVTTKTISEQ